MALLFHETWVRVAGSCGLVGGVLVRLMSGVLQGLEVPRRWRGSSWRGVPVAPVQGPGPSFVQAASWVSVQQTHTPLRQLAQ